MTPARTPRAGTTTAAGVLTIVVSVLWALLGIGIVIFGAAVDQADIVDDFDVDRDLQDSISGILIGAGVIVLAICAWTLILGIKVLQRRSWARWGTVATFALFSALFLLGVVSSASASDGTNPGLNVIALAVYVAIVVLLLVKPTADDFAMATAAEQGGGYGGWGGPQQPAWDQQQQWGSGWAAPPPPPPGQGQGQGQGWGQGWPPPPPQP
jgi:4-amino-4-deoxy-L-arabinose transferase-like glycosyltransferase